MKNIFSNVSFISLLVVAFATMLLATVLFTNYLVFNNSNQIIQSVITKFAHYTAKDVTQEIARFLKTPESINQNTLRTVRSNRVDPSDMNNMSRYLWDTAQRDIDFSLSSIYYASGDGSFISIDMEEHPDAEDHQVFSVSNPATDGIYTDYKATDSGYLGEQLESHGKFDPRVRPWYRKAIANPSASIWSDVYSDFDTKLATITHAIAINDEDGNLLGVAAVDLYLEHVHEFLATLEITQNSEVFVMDEQGLIIAAFAPAIVSDQPIHNIPAHESPYPYTREAVKFHSNNTDNLVLTNGVYDDAIVLNESVGHLHLKPVGQAQGVNWTLGVFIPKNDFLAGATRQTITTVPLFLLAIFIAIALALAFARRIVEPVQQLQTDAGLIAAGNFNVPVNTNTIGVVGELAKSIDSMRIDLKHKISTLHESNQQLATEKSRVDATLDSIEDGVITLDSDDRITFINQSAQRKSGWISTEVVGRSLSDVTKDNESTQSIEKNILRALQSTIAKAEEKLTESVLTLTPLADGSSQFCRLSPVLENSKRRIGSVMVFNDTSELLELKIRHQEVKAAGNQLAKIVEESANEIFIVEPGTYHVIRMNRAARENLGYTAKEALTLRAWDIVEGLNPELATRIAAPLLQGDKGVIHLENFHRRKDGSTYPTETRLHYMRNESPPFLAVIVQDSTERRKQLAELLLRDRAIAELDTGVLICDALKPDMPIVYINRAIEKMTGYKTSDLIGKNPRLLQATNTNQPEISKIRLALQRAEPVQSTLLNYRKDGTEFTTELSISPVRDESGVVTHFIGIQNDATERLITERRLRDAQRIDAIGKLSGGIAHDFNNVLGIISGRLEMLNDSVTNQTQAVHISEATNAVDMGARLTNRLLAFSSQGSLEPTSVNLNDAIYHALEILRPTIGDDVTFKVSLDTQLWNTRIDPSEIENSLINLAINARDAMPAGGTIFVSTENISISNTVPFDENDLHAGEFVLLTFSDTGAGMDAATQSRIFEPFFTTKSADKGTGLGLASVFGFARQSGGTVKVESELGAGTSIKLYLPRHKTHLAEEKTVSENKHTQATAELHGYRILVVEDNEKLRLLTTTHLRELGCIVSEADSGIKAIELLKSNLCVDLVFSDIVMPGAVNGLELADWINDNMPNCRVLLTSGFSDQQNDRNRSHSGTKRKVLKKPYKFQSLQNEICSILQTENTV